MRAAPLHLRVVAIAGIGSFVGCGDAEGFDAWDDEVETDEDAYVILDERARDAGLSLIVTGLCVGRTAELPEPVGSTSWAYVRAFAEPDGHGSAQRLLELVPGRVLAVSGLDDPPEVLEIDPDRASVSATRARAVMDLVSSVHGVAVTRNDDVARLPGSPRVYTLRGGAVWENVAAIDEWPDGIVAIHPVAVRDVPESDTIAPEVSMDDVDDEDVLEGDVDETLEI